jgi:hypothetical protein
MTPMRRGLPEANSRIANLPRDSRGFPVPWFVQWFSDGKAGEPGVGEPDFRAADERKFVRAIKERRCWVCGQPLGQYMAFVIGPMCAVNRVTAEPPCHLDCATFSAIGCPFLSQPRMRRNEKEMPEHKDAPGFMITRNPGATCVWVTKSFSTFRPHKGGSGLMFFLHPPTSVVWFAEGREATCAEVVASIESGFPLLLEMAQKEGPAAIRDLYEQLARAVPLLPRIAA